MKILLEYCASLKYFDSNLSVILYLEQFFNMSTYKEKNIHEISHYMRSGEWYLNVKAIFT